MNFDEVVIRQVRALRGPNLHAHMPVLQITLEIGSYEDRPSDTFPGLADRLCTWLPGLGEHQCSVGKRGGFIERLRRGTYLPHIVEHICIELQNRMGFNVSFGRARGTGEVGVYTVIVAYKEEVPARESFFSAIRIALAAMHDQPFDVTSEIERLTSLADEYRYGPSTQAIVSAARKKGIPITRLGEKRGLVQLGYGVYQKRIAASETSHTSAIAVSICQEKPLTNRLLRSVGVPVPEGQSVYSADEAWEVARTLGLPVVIKPDAGNQGKGVSTNLRAEDAIKRAYEIAARFGDVLVERYVIGDDHRLLIVDGKMVAAARREPATVIGDGEHTISELVETANRDPRRRPGHSSILTRITIDDSTQLALAEQGLACSSIPQPGQKVRLRTNCNLSTGGTATDVTDMVHPANIRVAELAAQFLGLDVAGIDILCSDISRPLHEQGGAIVEVNAAPGLRMHLHPAAGLARDVGAPIVEMLYPDKSPSRIPIIAITGTNGKTTVTRLLSHMYETAHWTVGMTLTEGTFINGEKVLSGDCSGPKSAQAVLLHPHVEVAVLETARGGILREGLAFDYCQVGVVTNLSEDHLGISGINSLDDLAKVKQVVVEAVHSEGVAVLNAEDPRVAEMAAATNARVIYFSTNPRNPVIQAHLAEGHQAVLVEDNSIVLATGNERVDLVELTRVHFTFDGKVRFQVQNAIAATAAAWAGNLNPAIIVRALTTFRTDSATLPARFNVQDIHGVEVILDYGHNPAALVALGEAIEVFGSRRTVMVIGLPGDRRDRDIQASIRATRNYVDAYVFHDHLDRRERTPGEIPLLMEQALEPNVARFKTSTQERAIELAWSQLRPGDRLVVIVDKVEDMIHQLQQLEPPDKETGEHGQSFAEAFEAAFDQVSASHRASKNTPPPTILAAPPRQAGWGYSRTAN